MILPPVTFHSANPCRMSVSRTFVALAAALVGSMAGAAPPPQYDGGPGWLQISPRSTFYRTANDPKAEAPVFFILAELPFSDVTKPLTIEVFGDYKAKSTEGDVRTVLHGVFTKTATALASNLQKRLPDALNAGTDVATGPTNNLGLATDIVEDFRIIPCNGKFQVAIPAGAQWVIVCVPDAFYGDNVDPDGDLWVRFSRQ